MIFLLLTAALIICGFTLGWFDGPALLQKLADIQDDIRSYVDANLFTAVGHSIRNLYRIIYHCVSV